MRTCSRVRLPKTNREPLFVKFKEHLNVPKSLLQEWSSNQLKLLRPQIKQNKNQQKARRLYQAKQRCLSKLLAALITYQIVSIWPGCCRTMASHLWIKVRKLMLV